MQNFIMSINPTHKQARPYVDYTYYNTVCQITQMPLTAENYHQWHFGRGLSQILPLAIS